LLFVGSVLGTPFRPAVSQKGASAAMRRHNQPSPRRKPSIHKPFCVNASERSDAAPQPPWRIIGRMAAPRTLWLALVGLYEETATLVLANLAWVLASLPLVLALALLLVPFANSIPGTTGPEWVLVLIAWTILFMPTPAGTALAQVASVAAGPDVPKIGMFWEALRTKWRMSLVCFVISLLVACALLANVYFYAFVSSGPIRFFAIVWLYGALFWFSMHVYLVPLLVHVAEPRILDIYRRAALIAIGHPIFTLLVLFELLIIGSLALIFLPAYVLVGPAYLAMIQAHAFREIRRRHGDIVAEPDEGGLKL
jgi:uncharacterized membrane protein YesL